MGDQTRLRQRERIALVGRVARWVAVSLSLMAGSLLLGIGVAAILARNASAETWSRWSDIGQTFGVLSSVFSGFALAALIVTFWMQLHELKSQREELALQRESLSRTQSELHRSAEANLRRLHVDLLKMGMDDPELGVVWPLFTTNLPEVRIKQYLYANLILQHTFLQRRIGLFTDDEMLTNLRYMLTSPLIREFWQATRVYRASLLVPGTADFEYACMVDRICDEYEAVLERARERHTNGSHSQTGEKWEGLDANQVPNST